jgi:hypothetical protein
MKKIWIIPFSIEDITNYALKIFWRWASDGCFMSAGKHCNNYIAGSGRDRKSAAASPI